MVANQQQMADQKRQASSEIERLKSEAKAGGLGGLGVPSAPAAPVINPPPSTETRDLLSGDSLDPLGVLGAAPVREKPKESIFNASSRKQLKKKD